MNPTNLFHSMEHRDCLESRSICLLDSITSGTHEQRDRVVICGSHGGNYAAYCAARLAVRGAVFNDAGVGKDNAGIAGLSMLEALGVPAATVGNQTARIGDGHDTAKRGKISHVNRVAARLGCLIGEPCIDAAERLLSAPSFCGVVPEIEETRFEVLRDRVGRRVMCMDSASLVTSDDAGQVLVIGSHGGFAADRPEAALKVDAAAAVFHDAGVGIEQAGIRRLALLESRGIVAATVDGNTARIGDGRSLYETGIISHVNSVGLRLGVLPGQSVRRCGEVLLLALPSRDGSKGRSKYSF